MTIGKTSKKNPTFCFWLTMCFAQQSTINFFAANDVLFKNPNKCWNEGCQNVSSLEYRTYVGPRTCILSSLSVVSVIWGIDIKLENTTDECVE